MAHGEAQFSSGTVVGAQLVRHEDIRCIALLFEKLAHKAHGSGFIPFRLDQQVQDLALAIDRSPQPEPPSIDGDNHFVEMPLQTRARTAGAEPLSELRAELEDPTSHRLVRDIDAALGQEFLDVTVAEGEAEIESNGMTDDLRREPVSGVGDGLHA